MVKRNRWSGREWRPRVSKIVWGSYILLEVGGSINSKQKLFPTVVLQKPLSKKELRQVEPQSSFLPMGEKHFNVRWGTGQNTIRFTVFQNCLFILQSLTWPLLKLVLSGALGASSKAHVGHIFSHCPIFRYVWLQCWFDSGIPSHTFPNSLKNTSLNSWARSVEASYRGICS